MLETKMRFALSAKTPLLSCGDGVDALLGYSAADFLSGAVTLWSRVHTGDEDISQILRSGAADAATGTQNMRVRQANGQIRCVKVDYAQSTDPKTGEKFLELHLQDAKSLARTLSDAALTVNFRAMMENTDDYIYFKDRNHVFTGASQTLVALCEPVKHWTDFLGKTDYDVFPERFADIYYELEKQVFAGIPVAKELQETLTKDGKKGLVDNRKYPIRGEHGEIVGLYGIARDITDYRRAEDSLNEFFEQPMNPHMIAGLDGKIQRVNSKMLEVLGYTQNELVGSNFLDLIHPEDRNATLSQMALLAQGQNVFYFENRYRHKNGSYRHLAWSASVSQLDRLIYAVANDVTEKIRTEKAMKSYVENLESAFKKTVSIVTNVCEMRDAYNAGHQHRVAEIAYAIGAELGLTPQQQDGLKVAGLLHDVGTISVPTEIPLKPGPLNDIEFSMVKAHTTAGFDLLKDAEFPWPVALVALQHHERLDGSGYPQGLKGEKIILEARIIAVADVIEAMSSHRPYRPALGIEAALDEIKRGRGILYDASVADAALRLFREKGFTIPH